MSIEAQALTKLIQRGDHLLTQTQWGPSSMRRYVLWMINEAKYWVHPLQSHMNAVYSEWNPIPEWPREHFLRVVERATINEAKPFLQCVVLGNMNFNVEAEGGFYNWQKLGYATEKDFEVLDKIFEGLKTPVGYKARACILSVKTFVMGYRSFEHLTEDDERRLKQDLDVLTAVYLSFRYDLLIEVERNVRMAVPEFYPEPKFL
jgi:hypothetical protein